MKINFTKNEYRVLIEMLLTADWIIHAHEDEPVEDTKSYTDLRKKVLAHFKEMGMGDDFRYHREHDEYYETKDYEEHSAHMTFINEYDERSFWSLLATKMAQRTLAIEHAKSPRDSGNQEQQVLRMFEITDYFEEEFSKHGLDNIHMERKNGVH